VAKTASDSFDEHERPTAPRGHVAPDGTPNATSRMEPVDLEELIARQHAPARPASGTRPLVTASEIERFVRDRDERETLDALTLQRQTLPMKERHAPEAPSALAIPIPNPIPIDVDDSAFAARPRERLAAAPQRMLLAVVFAVAVVSALLGFVAGRASL